MNAVCGKRRRNGKCIENFQGRDHLCGIITLKIVTVVPCRDGDWIEPVQDTGRLYVFVKETANIRVP